MRELINKFPGLIFRSQYRRETVNNIIASTSTIRELSIYVS